MIGAAQSWLAKSKADQPETFHLEAAIAMQHCIAPSVETTDWSTIVHLYSRLLQLRDSPIYALNRAIAIGQAGDTHAAMSQLQSLRDREDMKQYNICYLIVRSPAFMSWKAIRTTQSTPTWMHWPRRLPAREGVAGMQTAKVNRLKRVSIRSLSFLSLEPNLKTG